MKDRDTPLPFVRLVNKVIPGIYGIIDSLSAQNVPVAPGWPKFNDTPIELNITCILCMNGIDSQMAAHMAPVATACYMWRANKAVYSFDDDLSNALAEQADSFKDTDVLPADILIHPPYECTFVGTSIFKRYRGFWYRVGPGIAPNVSRLQVVLVSRDMKSSATMGINLLHGKTIRECWYDTVAGMEEDVRPSLHDLLVALQFVLYLASENADIQDVPQAEPPRVRKKRGQILDKASEVKEKAVGVRIGNAIRKIKSPSHPSSQGGTGTKVRPHSRRGHWHHYWTGPRDGDRKLILKWTAPTFIHMDEFRNDTVVVYPVRQERNAS